MRRRQTAADVSRGVPPFATLKKKKKEKSRAVQSSRHFTPYFLRDCVVRAVKRPLPEDRHKLESRGIRKSHSRVGNRSVCERKPPAFQLFLPRGSLFLSFSFSSCCETKHLKITRYRVDLPTCSSSHRNRFHVSTCLVTSPLSWNSRRSKGN